MKRGAVILALVVLAGCGGGGAGSNDVTFTRADGSTPSLPTNVRAWCGPYDDENSDVEAVFVFAGEVPRDKLVSLWYVQAVREDIAGDPATALPNDFVSEEPRAASMFAFDVEDRENELSSAEEESSGTIRVESSGCEPGDSVSVEFDDVVLGSEYHDLPTMSVSGTVDAEVGEPPN